jgi:hypothetical protein
VVGPHFFFLDLQLMKLWFSHLFRFHKNLGFVVGRPLSNTHKGALFFLHRLFGLGNICFRPRDYLIRGTYFLCATVGIRQ